MYYVLNLRKTHLIKGDELNTECGQLVGMPWRQTLGDESEAIKFRRPRRQMWSPRWEPSLKTYLISLLKGIIFLLADGVGANVSLYNCLVATTKR